MLKHFYTHTLAHPNPERRVTDNSVVRDHVVKLNI